MQVVQVATDSELAEVRRLFVEYHEFLGFDLCFQNFRHELEELPGFYAPPAGRLLLAKRDGRSAGCVALRALDARVCEMKRLFVRPEFRGHGVGRALAETVVEHACAIGYASMRLDTVPKLATAIELYRDMGFQPTAPYCNNPIEGALYFELRLGPGEPA